MPPDTHFEGKVAIVTGAASGIGRAIASALAARGASVVFADVDEVGAQRASEQLHAGPPGRASSAALDVRDAEAVTELVRADRQGTRAPGPDVQQRGHRDRRRSDASMTLAHFERAIDVNLRGVVHGVLAAYPVMTHQGRGHIVNTASLAGLVPAPGITPYSMTKHAVVGLSMSLRAEAQRRRCPGERRVPRGDRHADPGQAEPAGPSPGRRLHGRAGDARAPHRQGVPAGAPGT